MSMGENPFKILSIDGGGIRGVFPAHVLQCIETRLNINVLNSVDFISGTSTGAIIAAAVACGINTNIILELYQKNGCMIFPKQIPIYRKYIKTALISRYKKDTLYQILKDIFGDKKLGDIEKPLLIPATDIGNGNVHVFKSSYSQVFTRDKNVLVREAILASCSAPTYYDPTRVKEYLLADGGIWANCPALAAVIEAQKRFHIKLPDVRVLSIGTGHAKTCYGVKNRKMWGFLVNWKGSSFIDFFMSLQAQATNNYLQLLLDPGQILRINFETDCELPMDDCKEIDNLISRADKEFTYNTNKIENFFK
jgi:uncharacterized protein